MNDSNAYSDQPTLRAQGYELPLVFWVVTRTPRNLPGWPYVARRWEANQPTSTYYGSRTLSALRLLLRLDEGCELCIDRDESDDPVIVETWL